MGGNVRIAEEAIRMFESHDKSEPFMSRDGLIKFFSTVKPAFEARSFLPSADPRQASMIDDALKKLNSQVPISDEELIAMNDYAQSLNVAYLENLRIFVDNTQRG